MRFSSWRHDWMLYYHWIGLIACSSLVSIVCHGLNFVNLLKLFLDKVCCVGFCSDYIRSYLLQFDKSYPS